MVSYVSLNCVISRRGRGGALPLAEPDAASPASLISMHRLKVQYVSPNCSVCLGGLFLLLGGVGVVEAEQHLPAVLLREVGVEHACLDVAWCMYWALNMRALVVWRVQ